MQSKDYQKLRECPFCGGEAKFVHIFENPEKCMVSCRECDGGIDAVFANEEAAAEAWNRRAQPANEPLVRCGECAKYKTRNCAAKHEQALTDFCSHGVCKPEWSENE